jgi:hypothetical protein
MREIQVGEEITISYCDMGHYKALRARELRYYGFVCDCRACTEADEDELSFGFDSAGRRMRLDDLMKRTEKLRGPRLEESAARQDFVDDLREMAALLTAEGAFNAQLARV